MLMMLRAVVHPHQDPARSAHIIDSDMNLPPMSWMRMPTADWSWIPCSSQSLGPHRIDSVVHPTD